jgi:FkbH-like protein
VKTFDELKKNTKKDSSGFREVRLAILADSAVQFYATALRGEAFDRRLNLVVLEGDFNQIDRLILDRSSELYRFRPRFVIIWHSSERLLEAFQTSSPVERASFADRHIAHVQHLVEELSEHLSLTIIYFNGPELDDSVFGSFANKTPQSWVYQIRRINYLLMEFAASRDDFFINDLGLLFNDYGRAFAQDRRLAAWGNILLSIDLLPMVARNTLNIVEAILGRLRKCLVLDLDNTLWGGVIGDDGLENIELGQLGLGAAYTELQLWARELKRRGILLAVCSKNDARMASEVFERHPDMILRLDDFAVFSVNWNSKVDNLRHIQGVLDIGFDSMVFLDDSAAEREAVRMSLPEVCVPELPGDPVDVMPFLRRQNLFETASLTGEDFARTARYQAESRRRALRTSSKTDDEFLATLDMVSRVEGFTAFNIPRVAQLTQRSNQFNLRTVRFSEGELQRIAHSREHVPFAFSLQDRIGDYGLVSVVILEAAANAMLVSTWLMSCRVLKRGLENLVLDVLVEATRERGAAGIVGEYLPTAKNGLVKDHYSTLGFERQGDRWYLDLKKYRPLSHFIRKA